ncbi:MAG: STT3 domain-containing protein [Campylobacterota bacterium]
MLLAYVFSITVRLIWVFQFQDNPNFHWQDQLMINTNDGYYFASAAQHLLEGSLAYNPQIPVALSAYPGIVYITEFLTRVLPVSLNTVILYMPAFISSLVVIPLILIGRLFNLTQIGFFAALLGSIAWSYYNRTMVGYYDSDMFAVLLQYTILFTLLATIIRKSLTYAVLSFMFIVLYPYMYPQGIALLFAMYLLVVVVLVTLYRKEPFSYVSIAIIGLALINIPLIVKLLILALIIIAFTKKILQNNYWVYLGLGTLLALLTYSDITALIINKFSLYLDRSVESSGLHFFQVSQTVREAGIIPFDTMANRISGSVIGLFAALAGYIILVIRHKEFILALPLIGIGIFSLMGGLRFTVYAVPIAAISAIYLFHIIAMYTKDKKTYYIILTVLTTAIIYPNITHIIGYKVPTVFMAKEVQILDNLKKQSSSKDYVITWWDYGYPIWYYADKNTIIDGGKHHHDNFIVSEVLLTTSPLEAARLSRLAVETYIDSDYKNIADTLFKNRQEDQVDVSAYLEDLRYGDVTLPEKSRDIFLYLPMRMLDILPTVKIFSNIDLSSGKPITSPFFYSTQRFQDSGSVIQLGNGIALLKQEGVVQIGNQKVPLGEFIKIRYDRNGQLDINRQTITPMSRLSIIYLESYQRFLVLDNEYLNSTFIQMYIFENYDRELFEPVILDPLVKIYKLKI